MVGLGREAAKKGAGAEGEGSDLGRARPALGEDLELPPEAARGEAKETVLIMGRSEQVVADAFIDSSDAKYNGAFAFAKPPFSRIPCDFRLGARRFEWCKALALRATLCFARAKGGQFLSEWKEALDKAASEMDVSFLDLCIFPAPCPMARQIHLFCWMKQAFLGAI